MSWNYRLLKKDDLYGIFEVYYNGDKPTSCSVDPQPIIGESAEDVMDIVEKIQEAIKKPILNYEDF